MWGGIAELVYLLVCSRVMEESWISFAVEVYGSIIIYLTVLCLLRESEITLILTKLKTRLMEYKKR